MFNSSYIENNFTSEDGTQYKIKIDSSTIFKAKFIQYVRKGLKIEKMLVPASVATIFKNTPISDNGKYILYTSVPEYLINPEESAQDLIHSFKNWITRFMHYNESEEEYNILKENHKLVVEIRNKIRKEEQWTKENADLYANSYYLAWRLHNTLGADKLSALSNQINELSDEELNKLMEQYEKMLEENPELFEGLSDLLGGY